MIAPRTASLLILFLTVATSAPADAAERAPMIQRLAVATKARLGVAAVRSKIGLVKHAAQVVAPAARGVTRTGLFMGGLAVLGHSMDPHSAATPEWSSAQFSLGLNMIFGAFARKERFAGRLALQSIPTAVMMASAYGFSHINNHDVGGAVYLPTLFATGVGFVGGAAVSIQTARE